MNGASEQEIRERAMNDPEVREIMQDPIMKNILQQMLQDPSAAQEFVLACFVNIVESCCNRFFKTAVCLFNTTYSKWLNVLEKKYVQFVYMLFI